MFPLIGDYQNQKVNDIIISGCYFYNLCWVFLCNEILSPMEKYHIIIPTYNLYT